MKIINFLLKVHCCFENIFHFQWLRLNIKLSSSLFFKRNSVYVLNYIKRKMDTKTVKISNVICAKVKKRNDNCKNLSYFLPTSYLGFQGQKIFQSSVPALINTISSISLYFMR